MITTTYVNLIMELNYEKLMMLCMEILMLYSIMLDTAIMHAYNSIPKLC